MSEKLGGIKGILFFSFWLAVGVFMVYMAVKYN